VPSLALIFHVVDGSGAAVGEEACELAIAWAEYLESHARRAYDLVLRSDAAAARALGEKIRKGELAGPFTLRDVHQRDWAQLTDREAVVAAVELLEDLGWLRSRTLATGGRPKTEYEVNPRLREGADGRPRREAGKAARAEGAGPFGGFEGPASHVWQIFEPAGDGLSKVLKVLPPACASFPRPFLRGLALSVGTYTPP
jgi:hypothetical protein